MHASHVQYSGLETAIERQLACMGRSQGTFSDGRRFLADIRLTGSLTFPPPSRSAELQPCTLPFGDGFFLVGDELPGNAAVDGDPAALDIIGSRPQWISWIWLRERPGRVRLRWDTQYAGAIKFSFRRLTNWTSRTARAVARRVEDIWSQDRGVMLGCTGAKRNRVRLFVAGI